MRKTLCVLFSIILLLSASFTFAENDPIANKGKKWRIGYYEGGPYEEYQDEFVSIIAGFVKLKWMAKLKHPHLKDPEDTKELWMYLAKNTKSDYIEFVKEAYWSSDWDNIKRIKAKASAIQMLADKKLDMVIACGTWAGLDLVNNQHSVPTIVVSTSDPVRAGMIGSYYDSGFDHVFVKTNPEHFINQIILFHDLVQFKSLGFVYENTVDGRTYACYDDLLTVSKKRGFKVVPCVSQESDLSKKEIYERVIKCVEGMSGTIDAFHIADHNGTTQSNLPNIIEILLKGKVATWSQIGEDHTKLGVLFSVSREEVDETMSRPTKRGMWLAETCAKIFHGAKPRVLQQVYIDPLNLSFNTKTAEMIGYDPPLNLLKRIDKTYNSIPGY
jgi:ABC-type uncharacterized transport system substrate-binding protein